MKRMIRLSGLGVCALATGCASVTGGNTQKMYVQTESQTGAPVAGADCSLSNDKGTWRIQSPGDTSITRSNKRMEVKCDKSSLPQGIVSVESSTRAAMFGNIIIGGVVGAVIDHSSGAAYEYPEVIKVIMGRMSILDTPKGATPAATAEAIKNANIRPAGGAPPGVTAVRAAAPAPVPQGGPSASGQARIDDVDAVPYLGDKGREDYRQWVGRPTPKAFAVATDGAWFGAWSLTPANPAHPTDPMVTLLDTCAREGRRCWLYAVDDQVVWREDVQQRISRSDQLGK